MSKSKIFELAYVVAISTIILVIGLFNGVSDLSSLYVLVGVYALNILSAFIVLRLKVDDIYIFKFYFVMLHLYLLGTAYLTGLSIANFYIFGTILLISTLLTLGTYYSLISFVVLNVTNIFLAEDSLWLTAFVLLNLFTYIYLVYLQQNYINQSKRVSSRLSKAEVERERLVSLINSMGDGVIATDEKGNIVLYNGAALDILDTNQSLENVPLFSVMKLHNHDGKEVDLISKAEESNGYLITRDLRLVLDEDEFVNLYIAISPVRLGFKNNSEMIGYIVVIRDISKEKSLEEERDEFISVVSHELRTPITIAEGNISNLQLILESKEEEIDENLRNSIEDAHQQVVFLADMINDLSTLSRADRGVLKVEPKEIDVTDLINSLVRDYTPDAQEKSIKFEYECDDGLKLYSSKLYVREVLQNFLTNAIKYTQDGSIKLTAKKVNNGVKFSVSDTGIGLSKSDQKKLFQKFFRSEDYRTRENSGTGLGLYVTLKLVKLLKAKIDVESKLNQGSTFSVVIPNYPS